MRLRQLLHGRQENVAILTHMHFLCIGVGSEHGRSCGK